MSCQGPGGSHHKACDCREALFAETVEALHVLDVVCGQMDRHFGAASKLLMSAVTGRPVATAEVLASGDAIGKLGDHIDAARSRARRALARAMEAGL